MARRKRGPTRGGGTQSRIHADFFSLSRIHAMRRKFGLSRNIANFGLKIDHFTKSRRKNLIFTNSRRIFMLFTHHAWKPFHAFTQIFFRFHAFTQEKKANHASRRPMGGPLYLKYRKKVELIFPNYFPNR